MNFGTLTTRFNKTTVVASYTSIRLALFATLLPLFMNVSLSSCSQADTTIAPETETHSAAREATSLINFDDFEQGGLSKIWGENLQNSSAGVIKSGLARTGNQAMRFAWKQSDNDANNSNLHSELYTAFLPVNDNERWYGFSLFMPAASMANDAEPVMITQWHDQPDAGYQASYPPIAFYMNPDNKLTLVYRASTVPIRTVKQLPTSQKILNAGTANFDRWVDVVVHIKWDATGNQGVIQMWQDGVSVVNEQNISVGYPNTRPYWKVGLYAWTGKATHSERVMYMDEVRVGNATANYDAVKPGRSNNTAKPQH